MVKRQATPTAPCISCSIKNISLIFFFFTVLVLVINKMKVPEAAHRITFVGEKWKAKYLQQDSQAWNNGT